MGLGSHVHSYSKAAKRGALIAEEGGNCTHIDAGDAGDIVSCAPLADRLDGGMVRISLCDVTDDIASALDVGQFEQDTNILDINRCFILWNAIIACKRCHEDEDLTQIHHGFGVFGGGEHK